MSRREEMGSGRAPRLAASVIAATLLLLGAAAVAWSAREDATFGGDGRVVTRFEIHPQRTGRIEDLAVGADGRVALATGGGKTQPIQLALLEADGSPARSFAGDGLVQPQLGAGRPFLADPVRVALTGRDRGFSLLVAGTVETGARDTEVEVRRYLADGRPAPGFGRNGAVASPGGEAVALFAAPDDGFVLFANDGPGRSSDSTAVVGRYGPRGALLDSGPSKRLQPFRHVIASGGGGFLAEVGWSRAKKLRLVRFDARGRIVARATPPTGARSRFSLIGADAQGRALGWLDGSLVRLRSDDRTVDTDFDAELPPCEGEGRSIRPSRGIAEAGGGILLVNGCGLVRLAPDGSADPSFAAGGYATAAAGSERLTLGPEGSVLFALWRGKQALPMLGRVDRGGAPDPRFGADGRVDLRLPAPRASTAAALVAHDGRLIAAGAALCGSECERFALARYRARSGRLDRGFGQGGKALGAKDMGSANDLAVAPGGDVVVVGSTPEGGVPPDRERAFTLERFHPSGRPDLRFGKRGVVTEQLARGGGRSEANAVAVQDDGRIVVAGLAACRVAGLCFTVARFRPGGSFDRSFGRGGVFRLDGGIQASDLAIDRGGKIVVTGGEGGYFETVRLTREGRLDRSFGGDGHVVHRQRVSFEKLVDYSIGPKALALGRDGSVTIAGGSRLSHAVFERYLPDGRRDPSFGRGGRLLVQRLGVADLAASRCGIVAAGSMTVPGREPQMAVAGIANDGRIHLHPRPLFPTDRRSHGTAVALAGDHAIVAGNRRSFGVSSEFALAATPLNTLLPRC